MSINASKASRSSAVSTSSPATYADRSLKNSMMAATAVLKLNRSSMSSVTFLMVRCTRLHKANAAPANASESTVTSTSVSRSTLVMIRFHTRFKKRNAPRIPSLVQSISRSGGPMNMVYRRSVSAPYCSTMSLGSTTLRFDLDILKLDTSSVLSQCGHFVALPPTSAGCSQPCSRQR